jgi:3-oxoacyl-[acyl-carrier-protein] synthase II
LSRFSQISLAAAKMAVEDSKLKIDNEDPYHIGISLGTAIGGLEVAEKECRVFYTKNMNEVSQFSAMCMNPNSGVGIIAVELKIKGPNITISTGCSAGLSAIGHAYDTLCAGRADVIIAGGAEAPLFPVTFESFCASHVLTERNGNPEKASRPFEKSRDGYVLGEGAGIVILETLEHALNRGVNIYAEVVGYGVTNDSYSMFKMEPSGKEVSRAIKMALENADLSPGNIDYINAHGSSSLISDKRETIAIKYTFGDYAYEIPISSIKSMIGQSLAASASIQFITSALVIRTDYIPPTINYEEPDPECDLDYVPNVSRNTKKINTALINSFGAGGNNISMILKKYN